MTPPTLTNAERRAVAAFERLARRWPRTLRLFSRNGTLTVLKPGDGRTIDEATITTTLAIPNDGGDPDGDDLA